MELVKIIYESVTKLRYLNLIRNTEFVKYERKLKYTNNKMNKMNILQTFKKILLISILIFVPFKIFNQTNYKVLLILPESNYISWNKQSDRIIKYNKVTSDSARSILLGILKIKNIKNIQFTLNKESKFQFNKEDSIYQRPVFNHLSIVTPLELNFPQAMENFYLSRKLSFQSLQKLNAINQESKFDYILIINCLELISKSCWNRNTYLNLHLNLYSSDLKELYGNKGNIRMRFTNHIFFDTYIYMIKNNINYIIQSIFAYI